MSDAGATPVRGVTNELAKERNRAAAERTLTSWIQICLALIGFGFAFDRIVGAIDRTQAGRTAIFQHSTIPTIALGAIGLGIFLLSLAMAVHQNDLRALERRDGRESLGAARLSMVSTAAIVLFGFVALLSLLVKLH